MVHHHTSPSLTHAQPLHLLATREAAHGETQLRHAFHCGEVLAPLGAHGEGEWLTMVSRD